jgi:choline monooxygenase
MPKFSVDPNIAKAKTPDTAIYTDPEVLAESREKVFAPSWQFIGHEDLVKENGDVYPFTLLPGYLDEPLVLTKVQQGELHLLSNVCTHRGNLIVDKACKLNNLKCRYHGRKFDLGGKFLSMPEFKEVEDFPTAEDNLAELEIFRWGPFLFTSVVPQLSSDAYFKDMMERMSWLPLHEFVPEPSLSRVFDVQANWALYCENYLEGFHIPFVHAGLNAVIDFGEYATELYFPYSSLQLGLARSGDDCFELPTGSPDAGKNIAAYYFWVFPNMMFNFYPWGLSVNVVEPVAVDRCRVKFFSYVWKPEKLDSGAGAGLDSVEAEDEEIVENVQCGVRSRFYKHGRYSVTREQGTHHFHGILVRSLGH